MRLSKVLARCAAAMISVALIACADPVEPEPDPEAAAQIGPSETLTPTLPAPSSTPRYVGLWATTQSGCESPAWRFSENAIVTQGDVSCDFSNVQMTATGYAVAATCRSEGNTTSHDMRISFAESARAMMVSGGPWQPSTSLVYCGPLPQE